MTDLSVAREFNQQNLITIPKTDMIALERKIESNYFINFTKNSRWSSDRIITIRKTEDGRILTVIYYERKPDGGVNLIYKVDRDLWQAYTDRFKP